MADPYLGEIRMAGFNFAPVGWAMCNGQTLSISQNTALFSLLGTTYGGDGVQTFQLPNFQSRVPVHMGQGLGLSPYEMGEVTGQESHTLLTTEMPAHSHLVAVGGAQTQNMPLGTFLAQDGAYAGSAVANQNLAAQSIEPTGGGLPHNNLQPLLVVNFIIALQGIFPSRN